MRKNRIYLSPPNVGKEETVSLQKVMRDGWISSVGPSINAFEEQLENIYPSRRVLTLNSGTSALHLSLILSNVGKGDTVIVGTFTFTACANVVLYQGAIPVLIDSEKKTWNLDPDLLKVYLKETRIKPKAVIVTHLYGVPAQIDKIKEICVEYDIQLIEDAAEAMGSSYCEKPLGSFGDFGILSFNGNKIITTSGGGALITDNEKYKKGLYLSTQANSGYLDYNHTEVGYNYRMSNVLAGIGIAQLGRLNDFISAKRAIFNHYKTHLSEYLEFPEEPTDSFCNRWLTTPLAKNEIEIQSLVKFLDENNIESRRLWRPMHQQHFLQPYELVRSGVSDALYSKGICLPSGSGLTREEQDFVIEKVISFFS